MESQDETFLKALIGLHAFTGCDSVSAFAGKGKIKAQKLLINSEFVNLFSLLGTSWFVTEDMIDRLSEFVSCLYGKRMEDIDLLRYQLYCAKGGKVEPDALPPCKATLTLHIKRANYQARIWRLATTPSPYVPSPYGHGWSVDGENDAIKWLGTNPAPEEIYVKLFVS